MSPERLIRLSAHSMIAALGAHIFCCGLPALATLASLIAGLGTAGTGFLDGFTETVEEWHPYLFAFSSVMLIVALTAAWIGARRHHGEDCGHAACAPVQKRTSGRMILIALALYAFNLVEFLLVH